VRDKILGSLLIGGVYVGTFVLTGLTEGFGVAAVIFALAFGIIAVTALGAWLMIK